MKLIKMALRDSNGKLKIQGHPRSNDRSVWYRKRLETTMFNIALDEVIRTIKTNINGTIFKRTRG